MSEAPSDGVMVAFILDPQQQNELAVPDGEPAEELHLTLAYLGKTGELPDDGEERLVRAVRFWAARTEPVTAITNGFGVFSTPSPVTYANVDAPDLPLARSRLIIAIQGEGLTHNQEHGYTPHITLAYSDRRDITVPVLTLLFTSVAVVYGGNTTIIPLTGPADAAAETSWQVSMNTTTTNRVTITGDFSSATGSTGTGASTPALPEPTAKAFAIEVGGRQLITGPASVLTAAEHPHLTLDDITSEHMLWMHGRFVGADEPNRNGALWSSGDLEMAQGTVTHGPLNWLHEAHHVIGTLAKSDYVNDEPGQKPHLTATAAVWRWLYPNEAYVVRQASDMEQLWYSMECVSKQVACAGPDGCGYTTSYAEYIAGAACAHVSERASVRRFINPVFLGGAVIVPPARPGWAHADARTMKTVNSLAEAAFEQAGEPDIDANTWEQLMAQVVAYAQR